MMFSRYSIAALLLFLEPLFSRNIQNHIDKNCVVFSERESKMDCVDTTMTQLKKVTLNNYSFRKKVAIGNYYITIYCYLFAVRKSTRQRPCGTKHFQFFSALNGKEPTGQIERR